MDRKSIFKKQGNHNNLRQKRIYMHDLYIKITHFFQKPFFRNEKTLMTIWIVLIPIIAWSTRYFNNDFHNYKVFENMFWHTIKQLPLYDYYPQEGLDKAHYGILFSVIIAPFALIPTAVGMLLWLVIGAFMLFWAIRKLPHTNSIFILWFCTHELLTTTYSQQTNGMVAACILLGFIFIEKEKDVWATFFIFLGAFIKLYSIVGLAFFFFSKQKRKFIISAVAWCILFFLLPLIIAPPSYIVSQYAEWMIDLSSKNEANLLAYSQNISLLGMVRKISQQTNYSDIWLIGMGILLFLSSYIRKKQYQHLPYRLFLLSLSLLFVVLFSTGTESSGYIIALCGVGIWYVAAPWKRSKWDTGVLIFVFIFTSMSPSDLFPPYIKDNFMQPYALKALPCVLVFFQLLIEMWRRDFSPQLYKNSQS